MAVELPVGDFSLCRTGATCSINNFLVIGHVVGGVIFLHYFGGVGLRDFSLVLGSSACVPRTVSNRIGHSLYGYLYVLTLMSVMT